MIKDPVAAFGGATVALLESRLADETAAMVRRLGGIPLSAPSLTEAPVDADADVAALARRLSATRGSLVVFLTGAAVVRLFTVADRLGCTEILREGLANAEIVARGPKPVGALARWGLMPVQGVGEPFTTTDVIQTLATIDVARRDVTVVHYGERSAPIVDTLSARGALVQELMLYEWRLPADVAPLSSAIDAIIGGAVQIVAFTSQIQVRHLLAVAGPDRVDPLIAALNARVLVGAVGPTCAAACEAAGLQSVVVPERPKLAPLLQLLAREWSARS